MENSRFTIPPVDQNGAAVFQDQGFYQAPQLIPDYLLDAAVEHMDKVIAGDYEVDPDSKYHFARAIAPGPPKDKLIKINNPHVVDHTLLRLITYSLIGQWAASVIDGAEKVQVWHTQLLYKPTGGSPKSNIGFHQDYQYWRFFDNPEGLFTAWIALSDVTVESGAMRLVRGSHCWGLIDPGNFAEQDEKKAIAGINVPEGEKWSEYTAVMPRGAISFHHPLTFHGSGPNMSDQPRRGIAVHFCTEKSRLADENPYVSPETLKKPEENPVIFGK